VRYIGDNTPESDQPGYDEATNANRALVEGQTVTLVKDVSETDRYGRLLRYVYVGNTFVNAEMVRQGYAESATYPPDVQFADFFAQLAGEARVANLGCWSANPWGTTAPTPASGGACDCASNLYNCSDFSTRLDAQACLDTCAAQGKGDVHGLDINNDGIAGESLP
jgi:micrococcal nuclease